MHIVFHGFINPVCNLVEDMCDAIYTMWQDTRNPENIRLYRSRHVLYLRRGLNQLSRGHTALDASRPWLVFWIIHSLELLGAIPSLESSVVTRTINFLNKCQHPSGGFGRGPGQLPHLAPTYAAVSALMILGARKTKRAFGIIRRKALYMWLLGLKVTYICIYMHTSYAIHWLLGLKATII